MHAINGAERAVNSEAMSGKVHFRRDLWPEVLF
jgi:hypothetical protein